MFEISDLIDKRYLVIGPCNDSGGMGALLFVKDTQGEHKGEIVLKYCRENGEEIVKRFGREVKVLSQYKGNTKVVQILDYNTEFYPPYYVMKYYRNGDLTTIIDRLQKKPAMQEQIFLEMIECASELHARNHYHRDIKPQNFLIDEDKVLISDFGLCMEIESKTGLTRSSMYWGTQGYLPPEFLNTGGFKHADAAGDIFMLGKSFYALLTGRDPTYLQADGIDPSIFHVIGRSCDINKENRYQSLAELKQNLVIAYDVILNRGGVLSETQHLLTTTIESLQFHQKYDPSKVIEFIEKLAFLENKDKIRICLELEEKFFATLRQYPVVAYTSNFLETYKIMVESEDYSWSFAEIIANNMQVLFLADEVPNKQKAFALTLAIEAAIRMNRYAAMHTCEHLISEVASEDLGIEVAPVILMYDKTFVKEIEPSSCKSEHIRRAISALNQPSKKGIDKLL